MRWGLREKLLIAAGAHVALLGIVGMVGLATAESSFAGLQDAVQHQVKELSIVGEINAQVNRVRSLERRTALTTADDERTVLIAQIPTEDAEVGALLDRLEDSESHFLDSNDVEHVHTLRSAWATYVSLQRAQLDALGPTSSEAGVHDLVEVNGALAGAFEPITTELAWFQSEVVRDSSADLIDSQRAFARNRDILLGLVALGGLASVLLGILHTARLTRVVRTLSGAAARVAAGEFGERVPVDAADEIGSLALSFNAMTADLQRLYRAAEDAVQAREEFISVASHDLRTPAASLLAQTQVALSRVRAGRIPAGPELQGLLSDLHQQSDRLARLVSQLLDSSQLKAGRAALAPQQVDLARLVHSAALAARATWPERPVRVSAPDELLALVDPLRFERVVVNLLDNALKYSPSGTPVEVQLLARGDESVSLSVRDHGAGIDPEVHHRLFERFFQVDRTGVGARSSGMGLGLYISRQIVDLHHGSITCEQPASGGTRFVVTVPRGLRLPVAA